jgi:hypothetical protein
MSKLKFTLKQQQLLALLRDGSKHSVADIMNRLFIGDPRSTIRNLRDSGIDIKDEWVPSINGGKYKKYWIESGRQ